MIAILAIGNYGDWKSRLHRQNPPARVEKTFLVRGGGHCLCSREFYSPGLLPIEITAIGNRAYTDKTRRRGLKKHSSSASGGHCLCSREFYSPGLLVIGNSGDWKSRLHRQNPPTRVENILRRRPADIVCVAANSIRPVIPRNATILYNHR
jgi:hypothetical protein